MKRLIFLTVAILIATLGFTQTVKVRNENYYNKLDQILSPFEDLTEYALDNNGSGMAKAIDNVNYAQKEMVFKHAMTAENYTILEQKLKNLRRYGIQNNFKEVALISSDIFKFNIKHFIHADKLKRQIQIEFLDYMGYQILALLKQDKVDWLAINDAIDIGNKNWHAIKPQVKDYNLMESFNLLFKGLTLTSTQKNNKIAQIFASMDLSLVDVLEVSF